MAFNFPNTPTLNQIATGPGGQQYIWDNTKWAAASSAPYLPLAGGTLTGPLALQYGGASSIVNVGYNNTSGPGVATGNLWRTGVNTGGNWNLYTNTAAAGDFSTSLNALSATPAGKVTVADFQSNLNVFTSSGYGYFGSYLNVGPGNPTLATGSRIGVTGSNNPGIALFNTTGGPTVGMWNGGSQLSFGTVNADGTPNTFYGYFNSAGKFFCTDFQSNLNVYVPSGYGSFANGVVTGLAGTPTNGQFWAHGSNCGYQFDDRTGTAPASWIWYATGGIARLWNATLGDVFRVTGTPQLQISSGTWLADLNGNHIISTDTSWTYVSYNNKPVYIYLSGSELLQLAGANSTTNARIRYVTNARTWLVGCRCDNGYWTIQDQSNSYNEYVSVHTDGSVNLSYALNVSGYCTLNDVRSNNNFYTSNGYLSVSGYISGSYITATSADSHLSRTFHTWDLLTNTNNNFSVGIGGNAWAQMNSYAYNNASGRADKTDIEAQTRALDKVKALRPVNFHWREEGVLDPQGTRLERKLHSGFIADEVAKVFGEDWGGYQNYQGHESIAYAELTSVLWRAVQELAAEVENLKKKVH